MTSMSGSGTVSLQHVRIDYSLNRGRDTFNAVRDVSFEIADRELVCLVGPSGCGKSTLLHAIAGLVPWTGGSLCINKEPVLGPGADRAVVFQKAALLPWKTVEANVVYALRLHRTDKSRAKAQASAVLDLVGLGDFKKMFPYQLSGGMQQRVNLARALAVDPHILLMDEPFSSLDAQQREVLQQELMRIWDVTDKTGLFVTHQIDEAVLLGDRVLVMTRGPSSTIQLELVIDFPRPRGREIRKERQFADYVEQIWNCLKDQQMV